jgi:hypothetical protein
MTSIDHKEHTLELDEEVDNESQTQYYELAPSILGGKKDSFAIPNFLHERDLKEILDITENQDENATISAFEYKTEEIPLDELDQNLLEDYDYGLGGYGFDEAFFSNLAVKDQVGTEQFWLHILQKRELDFQSQSVSKFQLRKMKKALESTKHKQVLSSLILSAHNPFISSIPQVGDPEINKEIQGKVKGPQINS